MAVNQYRHKKRDSAHSPLTSMIIRPIKIEDLDAFVALRNTGGVGLTSLPTHREKLAQRIETSIDAFGQIPDQPGAESYLFAMVDPSIGHMVGVCGIIARAGFPDPVYSYRVSTVIHASRELGVYNRIKCLNLSNDFSGMTELGSLLLHPDYRKGANGRLLSKSRFLFMTEFNRGFAEKVFAEMRGVSDDEGHSPFWDSLGRHFFTLEFAQADYLTGVISKTFIAELMPRHPLYVPLLSEEARQVIGKVHPSTAPALRMLEQEGFEYTGYVDIFDAGPTVEASRKNIRTVHTCRRATVKIESIDETPETYMLSNTQFETFRSVLGSARINDDQSVSIAPDTGRALDLTSGDPIRFVAI